MIPFPKNAYILHFSHAIRPLRPSKEREEREREREERARRAQRVSRKTGQTLKNRDSVFSRDVHRYPSSEKSINSDSDAYVQVLESYSQNREERFEE